MKNKLFKICVAFLIAALICTQSVTFYKMHTIQKKADEQFMNSYINLITYMRNKTLPIDGYTMHKLDIENTKCKHTMMLLYKDTSFHKDSYVDDIISTLNLVSGCDAVYEIEFSNHLYDKLKDLGQHISNDTCTQEISKSTWEALEKAVDFKKVKQARSYITED